MKETLSTVAIVATLAVSLLSASCTNRKFGEERAKSAELPLSRARGSEISSLPIGVEVKFEAIVVDQPNDKCIDLFLPDEFEKYKGDPKWAISSTLGFELGVFERLPARGKALVTGKYIFVRNAHDGPCGLVTGHLFEISELEYF